MEELSEVYNSPLPKNVPSLWESFLNSIEKYPDNLALVSVYQPAGLFGIPNQPLDDEDFFRKPYLRWSFRSLRSGISRLTNSLKGFGIKAGMPVITFLPNSAEYVLAAWSAHELGCVLVPISPRNLANKEEVAHMISTALKATPGQVPVIVALDPDMARQIDELPIPKETIRFAVANHASCEGWESFGNLMAEQQALEDTTDIIPAQATDDLILFTSGTTALPKGCFKTYPMLASTLEARKLFQDSIDPSHNIAPGDRCCLVAPNNHAIGNIMFVLSHGHGAAIVLPGPGFAPDDMLETLIREKITHTALVPTMVHALIGARATQGRKLKHLKSVALGGAVVSPELLRACIEDLGSEGVENAYGMTEGPLITTGNQRDPSKIVNDEDASIGWGLRGFAVRICDPETGKPVARNGLGELHVQGENIAHYIGDVGQESFYREGDDRVWFKTGDQARMDEQGRIYIAGRYKDMIIRGGENISPTALETTICKNPGLAALNPQIVGAPDTIAGEVPVAVVNGKVDSDTAEAIQDVVLKGMGTIYVPDEVISLQELGLSDYPRTMAGKVQKMKLAALVKKYRANQDTATTNADSARLAEDVKTIWAKSIGLDPTRLSVDAPLGEFADSITVMRVRDKIKRQIGMSLSLAEMVEAGTIGGQIRLLESSSVSAVQEKAHLKRTVREGPPSVGDMIHLTEDPDLLEPTKALILKTISPYGLDWEDVEDVMPAYDFANVMAETHIIDSWNFRFCIIPRSSDKAEVRKALEVMLTNNRILASFFIWDKDLLGSNDALHVAIRQNKKLFDIVIQDEGSVKTLEDAKKHAFKYPYPEHAIFPGPLYRALIYEVEETGGLAIIANVNHAIVDASMAQIIMEDLDRALDGASQLHEHVDYKLWADSYYNLRTSAEARAATKWHVRRLKNLEAHKKAIYPQLRTSRDAFDAIGQGEEDVVEYNFEAPDVLALRKEHPHLTAIIMLKAALALLNIHRTGHTHALFANHEAARTTFPFLPKSIEATGQFEATDVSGQTIESVINLIEFKPEETVLDFLSRMQEDQSNLTKYASAPWREIMAALGPSGSMLPDVVQAQIFNWVPGMGITGTHPYSNYKVVSAVVRPHLGFVVNAGMGGKESSTMFMHLRGDGFNFDGLREMGRCLEGITKWLTRRENWQKKPVKGFVAGLGKADA